MTFAERVARFEADWIEPFMFIVMPRVVWTALGLWAFGVLLMAMSGCATPRPVLEEAAFVGAAKANPWGRCACGLPRTPAGVVVVDAGPDKPPECQVALVCPRLHVEYVPAAAAQVPAALVADARREGDRRRLEEADRVSREAAAARELAEVKAELARRKREVGMLLRKPPVVGVLFSRTTDGAVR